MPVQAQQSIEQLQHRQAELEQQVEQLRLAGAELNVKLARYAERYGNAPVACLSLAPNGTILDLNLAASALLGGDRSRLTGCPLGQFIFAESLPEFNGLMANAFAGQSSAAGELVLLPPGLARRQVRFETVVRDISQECQMCIFDMAGCTPKGQSREDDEELFRVITNNVSDLIAILDAQGRRIYSSPSYAAMFGEQGLHAGEDSFALVHPDDREYVARALSETIDTGVGHRAGFRFLLKDGSVRHIESQSNFVRDLNNAEPRVVVVFRDVTERKLAAHQISSLNQRLTLAIAGAGAGYGVWELDLNSHRLGWDDQMLAIYGHTHETFGGTVAAWQDSVIPEDRQRVDELIAGLLVGGPVHQFEFRVFRASDAELRHVESSCYLQFDAEGLAQRVVGLSRDVTAQRNADDALKASEERHRLLVDHLPACVVVYAPDTSIVLCNAEAARTLGPTTQQKMLGKLATDSRWIFVREDGTAMPLEDHPVTRVIATGQPLTNYVVGVKLSSDSETAWMMVNAFPQYDARQQLLYVVVCFIDVTQGKRVEAALRVSEERLQRSLNASRISLWDFDIASGRIYLSEAWSEFLGGPCVPTTQTFEALAALVPVEDQAAIVTAMTATIKGISPRYAVEHRVRRVDGKLIWLLSKGRVVERDANARALRAVGTNQDITERKHAESTQHDLEAQLRESQKMQAIGTLAGGIAHDFNNILGAILGNVVLACQDLGEGHPAVAHLEQIRKSGVRARSLVQQILAFSRRQPQSLVTQSLRPLVEESLQLLRATLPAMVTLETTISDEPLNVLADAVQIQQVLMNLGTNAWHSLQGSVGQVHISLDAIVLGDDTVHYPGNLPVGHYARLSVQDTGCGMDETIRARVFEPFFTTKAVGHGTGLGLAVVHGIVTTHQGSITVNSVPGQGSRFDVYLPLLRPADEESTVVPAMPRL